MRTQFEYFSCNVETKDIENYVDLIKRMNDLGVEGWEIVTLSLQAKEAVMRVLKEGQPIGYRFYWQLLFKRERKDESSINQFKIT